MHLLLPLSLSLYDGLYMGLYNSWNKKINFIMIFVIKSS
jgi:hypothetical protein